MYFFVFLNQLYLIKYISKIYNTVIFNASFTKMGSNVSKFILFHKWTAIFKLDINCQFFTNFYIFEMFLPISQNRKMRKHAKR